jgi:hypothetical protein
MNVDNWGGGVPEQQIFIINGQHKPGVVITLHSGGMMKVFQIKDTLF